MERRCPTMDPFRIPMSCRQPRSQGARPPHPRGSFFELSSCKQGSSTTTTSGTDNSSHGPASTYKKEMADLFTVRCDLSLDAGLRGDILQTSEVDSASKHTLFHTCNNSYTGQSYSHHLYSHSTVESLPFSPAKSMIKVTGSLDSLVAPGSVVWAKTAYHEWWPAQVMDERPTIECPINQSDGLVPVRLYGVYECARVDPVNDLSQFDYCYEERSKNPLKAFQDALNQALHMKGHACSGEHSDKSPDKWNMSSSSRKNDDYVEKGRGKRKRKAKVHFDDMTCPENSGRRMRRMKIMRYLGLTAPVGSPFSRPHVRSAS